MRPGAWTGRRLLAELAKLEAYQQALLQEAGTEAMALIRERFAAETAERERLADETGGLFDCAFRYLEEALGESQELVIFVTEITAGYETSWYVESFGCDAYYRHNRDLLFDQNRSRIRREIEALE